MQNEMVDLQIFVPKVTFEQIPIRTLFLTRSISATSQKAMCYAWHKTLTFTK